MGGVVLVLLITSLTRRRRKKQIKTEDSKKWKSKGKKRKHGINHLWNVCVAHVAEEGLIHCAELACRGGGRIWVLSLYQLSCGVSFMHSWGIFSVVLDIKIFAHTHLSLWVCEHVYNIYGKYVLFLISPNLLNVFSFLWNCDNSRFYYYYYF